ncbi:hypothetical protein PoB_006331800 [Plakobranchus ocellatus]|uniref:Uncharacterized protein n=1 Tax=Plakobranchus ocellatus TaxID=259542 RepID=A0AAV4CY20_9GAST|nr:hypothetical protein PoB_006331800 [Plakobranchus ocellatus]
MPTMETRDGVDLPQQEVPGMQRLVGANKSARKGKKTVSFEKITGIIYHRFENPGINISMKKMILPKSLRRYVMSDTSPLQKSTYESGEQMRRS